MKCDKKWMPLYAVTDRSWLRGSTLVRQAEAAIRGGATCIQLREKELDKKAFLQEAFEMKALCVKYGVPLFINDDVEIAMACGADGVHIGQHDAPAGTVRKMIGPGMMLGVSAQTVEQALKAQEDGADCLGVGAVFTTGTKRDADDVSRETLKAICEAVEIPVVAIGGIKKENIADLAGSGIDGVAVVSAIFAAEDIEKAARELRETVRKELGV